jgi:hypothetical protein
MMTPFQRLVALCQPKPAEVVTRVMLEQEYWLFDRDLLRERPDLQAGQFLFGEYVKPHEVLLVAIDKAESSRERIREAALARHFVAVFHPQKKIRWTPEIKGGISLLDPKKETLLFCLLAGVVCEAIHEHRGLLSAALDTSSDITPIGLSEEAARRIESMIGWRPSSTLTPFFSFSNGGLCFLAGSSETFMLQIFEAIVSDQLALRLDELENALSREKGDKQEILSKYAAQVLDRVAPLVLSAQMLENAAPLPNNWLEGKTARALQHVLSDRELADKMNHLFESHARRIEAEAKLIVDVFSKKIVPALVKFQKNTLFQASMRVGQEIEQLGVKAADLGWQAKATVFSELLVPKIEELKRNITALEKLVGKEVWPLPSVSPRNHL